MAAMEAVRFGEHCFVAPCAVLLAAPHQWITCGVGAAIAAECFLQVILARPRPFLSSLSSPPLFLPSLVRLPASFGRPPSVSTRAAATQQT
jgi:hypothetical protein